MIPLERMQARFIKIVDYGPDGQWAHMRTDATFADCDGVEFLCPLCFLACDGPVGCHHVICFKSHVPQTCRPNPGRWDHIGSGMHDLSLVAGSSSIALLGGCNWHGFVQNGHAHTDLGPERVAAVRELLHRPRPQETPMDEQTQTPPTDTQAQPPQDPPPSGSPPPAVQDVVDEQEPAKGYVDQAPAGYVCTVGLAVIDRRYLCQRWDAPHSGQEPASVWVPVPGQ